MVLVYFGIW